MNSFIEILLIIMGATLTIWATTVTGYFYGYIKIFELILVGISIIRIVVLLSRKKTKVRQK